MKLFTKDIDKKLFAQFPKGGELANQKVIAKIFNPYGRGIWYIINSDPNDPDYLWAIVNLFEVEVGSVSRKELESLRIKPFMLPLERDLSFRERNAIEVYEGALKGERFEYGGEMDDSEGVDLFEDFEDQPEEVSELLSTLEVEDYNYDSLNDLLSEMKKIGYTFEFGLDAEPYDLRKIGQKGKSEFYAKGGEIEDKKLNETIKQLEPLIKKSSEITKKQAVEKNDENYTKLRDQLLPIRNKGFDILINGLNLKKGQIYKYNKIDESNIAFIKMTNVTEHFIEFHAYKRNINTNKVDINEYTRIYHLTNRLENFGVKDFLKMFKNISLLENDEIKWDINTDEYLLKSDKENKIKNEEIEKNNKKELAKDWFKFIKDNKSYFNIYEETEDMIHLNTREHGNVGDEQYGVEDVLFAKGIYEKVKEKYPNTKGRMYTIDEWVDLELTFVPNDKMAEGGKLDESTKMVLSQNKAIAHHTEELKRALKKDPNVEPWVIGKVGRAETDISDVTHYLDGRSEYARGGVMRKRKMTLYESKLMAENGKRVLVSHDAQQFYTIEDGVLYKTDDDLNHQKKFDMDKIDLTIMPMESYGGKYKKGGRTDIYLPVSQKISDKDIKDFEEYVNSFYGVGGVYQKDFNNGKGLTKREIKNAINKYFEHLSKNETWGHGDSMDRETVRAFVEGLMAKGGLTFDQKVKAVEKSLMSREVPKKYRNSYGKTYNKAEAHESAQKIIGAQLKKYNKK